MRNVNRINLYSHPYIRDGFILTMRNVNKENNAARTLSKSFYINYEECKL